ncbi:MAG: DNA-3-methyladenine glycosylase I [Clostridiales bacterium]|nr:DNA-3-methyladenine glycosylase I [Clostridiales bacterium]
MEQVRRCEWAGPDQIYIDYHDNEWGRPLHNDTKLFEMLILEGMQAGLAWITVLKKREAFREAFDGFDPHKVALYDDTKVEELMGNKGIIRHRGKINAAIGNAKAFLAIQEEYGSFDHFIWEYVGHAPIINAADSLAELPASTPLSDQISKDLKKRGFKFVGSTIIYSFMQAVGMVDDHMVWCPWHTHNRTNL